MPYRRIEAPVEEQEEEPEKKAFRRIEKPKAGALKRTAVNVPKEFAAEAVGQIPQLAELATATTPFVEEREQQARHPFLPDIESLEGSGEKGLRNLLNMLGQQDLVQKLTPESLRERFREKTEGEFEPQSKTEKVLGRGGALGGQLAGLGGGLRSILMGALGGLAGQTGREYGLNEPLATALEIGTSIGGEAARPELLAKAGEKKLVQHARKGGLTEKQITPLLKSPKAQEKLGQHALKTTELKKSIKDIGKKFDQNFYEPLKVNASKLPKLNEAQTAEFFDSLVPIQKELAHSKLPTVDKEYAKDQLVKLAEKVAEEGLSPRDIIDTWQDINKNIQWKKAGSKPYAAVKDALAKTFEKVSPELAEDFQLTNKLYSKFKPLERALEPKGLDNILNLGHEGEVAVALAFHNPSLIKAAFGHLGAKYIANQLLTNPRYHNFSQKMLNAIYKQDKQAISRLSKQFQQMVDKDMEKQK